MADRVPKSAGASGWALNEKMKNESVKFLFLLPENRLRRFPEGE